MKGSKAEAIVAALICGGVVKYWPQYQHSWLPSIIVFSVIAFLGISARHW